MLQELHSAFAAWPEIIRALMNSDVHAIRVRHWTRVVSGQPGNGFVESARELASAFYKHEVPGYAVAICHASVLNGIVADLGLGTGPERRSFFGSGAAHAKKVALRTTLTKLAWLDLEVLLEVYAWPKQNSHGTAGRLRPRPPTHQHRPERRCLTWTCPSRSTLLSNG